jgi:hypothetical protein
MQSQPVIRRLIDNEEKRVGMKQGQMPGNSRMEDLGMVKGDQSLPDDPKRLAKTPRNPWP